MVSPHAKLLASLGITVDQPNPGACLGDAWFGKGPALTSSAILAAAIAAPGAGMSLAPSTVSTIRRLSRLAPGTLAVMHGSSFTGDAGAALGGLAKHYLSRLQAALEDLPE